MRSGFSRRELMKLVGLTLATSAMPGTVSIASAQSSATPRLKRQSNLRNVIFMVADGMSTGVVSLADSFSRLVRSPQQQTNWMTLMRTPGVVQGMVESYSLNSMVTDSAAAASAWGSGSRVNNGTLNYLPDGRAMTPLARLMQQAGKRVGLVTTCTITHATPAGFAVNELKRGSERQIAQSYLSNGIDVLLGGGSRFFDAGSKEDQPDLRPQFVEKGYSVWSSRNDLLAGKAPDKVLGVFASGHLPYTIDQNQSEELKAQVPTIAEMTQAAINSLSKGRDGFFLMVEGGRVDHAAHANDAAAILWDQLAFDDALGVALAFAAGRDDTLVVVTTDHANSNPGLNSMGSRTGGTNACFARLGNITASASAMLSAINKSEGGVSEQAVKEVLQKTTQLEIPDNHVQALTRILRKEKIEELNSQHANAVGVLGQILGNFTGIGWTGVSHTADYTTLSAIGVGASAFQGMSRNIDAFAFITDMLGIDYRNPAMTPAEAWRVADASDIAPDDVVMV